MNAQIARLFGLIVVLFALLMVWTSRWTVLDASKLDNNTLNKLTLIHQLMIKRGRIVADDGATLAKSTKAGGGTWKRSYPTGSLFAQAIGYSNIALGSAAGMERSRGPELRGLQTGLDSVFGQVSSHPVGDDVYSTLDPKAQAVARQQLAGRTGAVVALNPQNGAVKVMYANPTYNNNAPPTKDVPGVSTFNRSTQSFYPPGSTFKVVTATAAIDSGKYTPNSVLSGKSPITVSGVPLSNDNNQGFGDISLTEALTYSVNTVWAQVAENLGRGTLTRYMKRFGFYKKPPLDYPPDEMSASWVYSPKGHRYPPGSADEDIGRIGIGQGGLAVTPLQMAMVASAVADGGKLMTPRLADKVVDPSGRTIETFAPSVYRQVMKRSSADEVAQMMKKVVDEGTGNQAQLGSGVTFAGKTGTASVGVAGLNLTQPWFIGFAPINNPKVAVAVTVERSNGGFGGTVAAPIAKAVVQTLLAEGQG